MSRDDLLTASFGGFSLVELKPGLRRSVTRTSISLALKPHARDGLLLHAQATANQFIRNGHAIMNQKTFAYS